MKPQEAENVDAHAEEKEEQPGELPNIPREPRRMAPSHRHRRPDKQQLKAWQEERDKTRLDVENVLHMYQEQQLQVSDLEKQLEQLKEREQQKSLEIHSLTQERDALQRGGMHLKKELAKVMQRLAGAEEVLEQERGTQEETSAVNGAPKVIEHLQMRVADYESLFVAFTEEANKTNEDGLQHVAALDSENTHGGMANLVDLTEIQLQLSLFQSRCAKAESEAKAAQKDCIQAQAEAEALADVSLRLAAAEEEGSASAWNCSEAKAEVQKLRENCAKAEAVAREYSDNALLAASSRCSQTEAELEVLRAQCTKVQEQLHNARTQVSELEAEKVQIEQLASISASRVATEEEEVRASALLHQQSETEAQELRRQCAQACLRSWAFKKAMRAARDRCIDIQSQAQEAAAGAAWQLENVEAKANAWASECTKLQAEAGVLNERCERVEAEAQKVRTLPDAATQHYKQAGMSANLEVEARFHQAHQEREAAWEKVEALQCDVEAAVKDKLRAARQTLVTSSMFDRLHQDLQKQVGKSQVAMRENRRAQMESVLAGILDKLHTTHFSARHDSRANSEAEEVQRKLECELAEAIQSAEEAKMRATKEIEMERSRAMAAEQAEVILRGKLDIQKLADDADELPRLHKEAGRAELRVEQLRAALEETEQQLAETRASLLEALSRDAASEEGHCGDIAAVTHTGGLISREGFEFVAQSQEDCMKSLQAHLEQEAEQSDLLAIAFEEILNVVQQLRAEKMVLDKLLGESKAECRQLCADLRQTLVTADARIAAVCGKHQEETSRMTEVFNTHLAVSNSREQDILKTLRAAQATNTELVQEEHALASLLEEERTAAGWREGKAERLFNELEYATQQRTTLEQRLADMAVDLRNSSSENAELQRESTERIFAATRHTTALQQELQEQEQLQTTLEAKLSSLALVEVTAAEQSEELHTYVADLASARYATAEVANELESAQKALTSEVAAQGVMEERMIVAEQISEHHKGELTEVHSKLEAELQKQAMEMIGSASDAKEAASQAAQSECEELVSEIENMQAVSATSELQTAALQEELAEAQETQRLAADKLAEASHELGLALAEETRSRQLYEIGLQTLQTQVAEETLVRNQLEQVESRMWQVDADYQILTRQLEEEVIRGQNALQEEMLSQKQQEEQLMELSNTQTALQEALATRQRLEQEVAQTSIEEHALQEASYARHHLEERLVQVSCEEVVFQEALTSRTELETALHTEMVTLHRCEQQVVQTEALRQDAVAEVSQVVSKAELDQNKAELQQQAAAQELSQMAAHIASEHNEVSQHKKQMEQQATAYMEQVRSQAKAAIAQRDSQIQELAHRLEKKEAQLQEGRDSLEVSSVELAQLTARNHALQASQEYSASQTAQLAENEPKLREELSDSVARSSALSQELAELGVEKDSLAHVTEELGFKSARLEALQQKLDRDLSTANSRQQTGLEEHLAVQKEVADLNEQLQAKQQENAIKSAECEVACQNMLHIEKLLSTKEIVCQEMSQKLERLESNHDFQDATAERDALREQVEHMGKALHEEGAATAEVDKFKKQLEAASRDCGTKSAELEVLSRQLATVSEERETMKQQLQSSALEMQNTLTQLALERDAVSEEGAALQLKNEILETTQTSLNTHLDEAKTQASFHVERSALLEAQLETSINQIHQTTAQSETAKAEYEMSLRERAALREELVASMMAPRGGADAELEITKQQLAQTMAERDAIEEAFQSSMQEMQRNLSQRSMEAEGLKQQLVEATTKLTEVARAPESAPAAPHPPTPPASAEEQQALSTRNRQLQRKIRDVEEEKQVMVQQLREHLMELARENYDLKQQLGGERVTAKNSVLEQAEEVDESPRPTFSQAGSSANVPEVQPGASSSFLSYVLSPFLTDSDKRELHAEAHAGQAGSLVLT